jgi:hypothetical protein
MNVATLMLWKHLWTPPNGVGGSGAARRSKPDRREKPSIA